MIKIQGKMEGELPIKRFCLDGLDIEVICPNCGHAQDYVSHFEYPVVNKPFKEQFDCFNCNHEWDEKLQLNISLEAIKT